MIEFYMKELLFLAHRFPYPLNKGDKIRSFNLVKHLSRDYRIHLGTFIDDPHDWQHVSALKDMCGETCVLNLDPRRARIRSLLNIATNQPLTLKYYKNIALQTWVDNVLSTFSIKRVLIFSTSMAQYMMDYMHAGIHLLSTL